MIDPINKQPTLPKSALIQGAYYVGRCSHGTIARWDGQVFWYWREKFDWIYLDTAPHPEDEAFIDVFFPVRKLTNPKFVIPFDADDDSKFDGKPEDLREFDMEFWGRFYTGFY